MCDNVIYSAQLVTAGTGILTLLDDPDLLIIPDRKENPS